MNFMEKIGATIAMFFLLIGFVCAAWGDIGTGDGENPVVLNDSTAISSNGSSTSNESFPNSVASMGDSDNNDFSGIGNKRYTQNFYIALGVGGVGFLIVIFFLYLFFRSPKNKWKS